MSANNSNRMVVQHHVNGEQAFLWEMAKFNPSQNQHPLTG